MTVGHPDLAVIGAGPAGVHAAMAARAAGLAVTLIDEARHAGGQVYRAPLDGGPGRGPDGQAGDTLRRALALSGVDVLSGHRVWTVSTRPIRLALAGPGAVRTVQPRTLVVATGTVERVVPFEGWTLPGVIGLAAATVLLKGAGPLPQGPIVVAGRGPLLAATAAGLLARGAHVACVVDGATRADWARTMPALLSRPDLMLRGAAWLRQIRRAGVQILHGHEVVEAYGERAVGAVRIRRVAGAAEWDRVVLARLLAIGQGLVPVTDVLALLGVARTHHTGEAAWWPVLDRDGRTSMPCVYAAGDGTGVRGTAAAGLAGRLAGLAAARDLGALAQREHTAQAAPLRYRLLRANRAGSALDRLMEPPARQLAAISARTVVCRCEDVTRAEIDAVFAAGARDLNQLKARTRCGMGPCQGRICAPAVSALASLHRHVAYPLEPWTVRPPIRPIPIAELVGAFGYDEIPSVTPAI